MYIIGLLNKGGGGFESFQIFSLVIGGVESGSIEMEGHLVENFFDRSAAFFAFG